MTKLRKEKILSHLRTKRIGRKVIVLDSTTSTNDIAAEHSTDINNDGLAVFAEFQTSGRGRSANKWLSEPSKSLLCSVLLTNCRCSSEILSITAAVAVAQTIGRISRHQARIKWPNDILIDNKKIAGILVESKTQGNHTIYIIGIGINCNQRTFPEEIAKTATSIIRHTKTNCDRTTLAKRLLTSLEHCLDDASKKPEIIIDQWQHLSTYFGHRLTLVFNSKKYSGHCLGIDPEYGLILQLDGGTRRIFPASQTTIVK